MRRYVTAKSAASPSPPISETSGSARIASSAETAIPNASDSHTACAPSRLAVSCSPAPPARATCAVVPYWRKLKTAKVPPRIVNAIPSAAS